MMKYYVIFNYLISFVVASSKYDLIYLKQVNTIKCFIPFSLLKKHIPVEEIPYACVRCVAKFLTKRKAGAHLRAHPGLEFRNTFTGTYVDTVAPQIRRLTDAEDEQHGMTPKMKEDMLKELYGSPRQQGPTGLISLEEETVVERIPPKRHTEAESTAAKKPRIAEEEVAALSGEKGKVSKFIYG